MITANEEAIGAWDGVLFDRFSKFRHVILPGNSVHSDAAMDRHPPPAGGRALDIGCGFGDTTQQLAELVGPSGKVLGVDAAPRFVEAARHEADEAGVANARFEVADVEGSSFDEGFDYAFSRFGTMFFANPVAALRNVRTSLAPGGQLCMVVWRRKLDNPWMYRSEVAVERFVTEDEDSDELTCGPGPFSMANADTTTDVVLAAGFEDVSMHRSDSLMRLGDDLDEAIALVTALGPAAEVIRLAGDDADRLRPEIEAAIREELAEYDAGDGVCAPMSTWIVSATAPAA
ncbi:MAG: class I SAM-dependent methyltransferase [Thermoleophilaceae bacterium]